jgi:hypothetical protein
MQFGLAQVLLTINVADPSNVTITGSGLNPAVTVAASTYAFPIRLDSFLTAQTTEEPTLVSASSSTLEATVSGRTMSQAVFNRSLPGFTSLSLRSSAGNVTEGFSTATPAFNTGVATFDFSHISDFLPLDGASGSIKTSDGSILGTYAVISSVPEPATCGVAAGVACLGFAAWRKRKAQATA